MREQGFIGLAPLWPKYLLKNQRIDFVSENSIREHCRISTRTLGQPFYRLFRELIQPHGSEPLLTVDEQGAILWRERVVDRWSRRLRKGRGSAPPATRQETGAMR